ncbi:MAG: DUF4338 domain-containing protein [Candidatus Synoicihabitans palmerolidicus]|nr:DUF4338 domain-containing protein [Candidatus Synoicihabitans palmerolidicus]
MRSKGETEREATNANPEQKHWDRNVEVRMATAAEQEWFDAQLHERHYLESGHPVGDYLRQIVEREGRAGGVALLAWGPACYALKDRDRWVGWECDPPGRAAFPGGAKPPLSTAAHPARRGDQFRLPGARCGRAHVAGPLAGTLRLSAAASRDLHRAGGLPRHVLQGLRVGADRDQPGLRTAPRRLLPRARQTQAPVAAAAPGTLPLKNGQLPSLLEALCGVPDPRAKNTRFKIGPVLGIVALALPAGRRDIASIARMANLLDQDQRFALALPREAGKKVRLARMALS